MTKNLPCYKLAAYFAAAQMVQEDISFNVLGCTPSTLSCYMNARSPFPLRVICILANEFNIPTSELGDVFIKPYAIKYDLPYDNDSEKNA